MTRHQVSAVIAQLIPHIMRGAHLDFFIQREITQTQFLLLVSIHAYGQCTMGELARQMHVSMPTASGVVNRLVHSGYVRRIDKPEDRRQVLVELTAKGKGFIRKFQDVVQRRWEEVLIGLSQVELLTLFRVVSALQERLRMEL